MHRMQIYYSVITTRARMDANVSRAGSRADSESFREPTDIPTTYLHANLHKFH